jgi:bifunctional non-homologous end joining protein LigD
MRANKGTRRAKKQISTRLKPYRLKRNFRRTTEPRGATPVQLPERRFVVQKHDASRLHYDFRLELEGLLLSWAVPKGPSLDPSVKRLAVQVEDHPIEYANFEGVIPPDEYGGGTVMVWDFGRWEPLTEPRKSYRNGRLAFRLLGRKLRGAWTLVRIRDRDGKNDGRNWLLIKTRDAEAKSLDVLAEDRSAISGQTLQGIGRNPDRAWSHGKMTQRAAAGSSRSPRRESTGDAGALPGARKAAMPRSLKPQLAMASGKAPIGDDWIQEIKYDGYRMIAFVQRGKVRLVTRSGIDWTSRFPSLQRELRTTGWTQAILDGEVVALTAGGASSFQALQNAMRDRATSPRFVYYLFDLPYFGGFDLSEAPLLERKNLLQTLLAAATSEEHLRFSDHVRGGGGGFFRFTCRSAMEGVVFKKATSPYRSVRSRDWVKVKCLNRQEFVIGGFTDPSGSRTGFGALLLGVYTTGGSLRYCGRVGTGFDQRSLARLSTMLKRAEQDRPPFADPPRIRSAHWTAPRLVAEVEFTEWTKDSMLRHPSFRGLREDKDPAEVRKEVPTARTGKGEAAAKDTATRDVVAGVRLTHPQRVLYPEQGITKRALAEYYTKVARWMLPHIIDRPVMIVRCPAGSGEPCFHQKHFTESLPDAVRKVSVQDTDSSEDYIAIHDLEGLVGLVQMGALEFHPWSSRAARLEKPDRMIFDLDPAEGVPWKEVMRAALRVRELVHTLKLAAFVRTTGGKGLHVVVPLAETSGWGEVKATAAAIVREMAGAYPGEYVATMSKRSRQGRIFIDHFRNARGATAVASYSTRARPGAPVAAPVAWAELTGRFVPGRFTVETMPQRLADLPEDPWKDFFELRRPISGAALRALRVKP